MKKRIIFMGTPEFASHILEQLLQAEHAEYEVVAVISQPDKPVGRKRVLQATPVKAIALQYDLPVLQPEKIGEAYEEIAAFAPDLIITAAYGQLVPTKILELPIFKCINIHGSLLPKYRGGAPIHRAIIAGEKETGITIMYMAKRLDAGDMLVKETVEILNDDTLETMYNKLKQVGANLLLEMLPAFFAGLIPAIAQVEADATFAPNIKREETKINWSQSNSEIYNHVRGLYPFPATFTTFAQTDVKIYAVALSDKQTTEIPGTIIFADNKCCIVATGSGAIALLDLQLSGKKRQNIQAVMNGAGRNLFKVGEKFE